MIVVKVEYTQLQAAGFGISGAETQAIVKEGDGLAGKDAGQAEPDHTGHQQNNHQQDAVQMPPPCSSDKAGKRQRDAEDGTLFSETGLCRQGYLWQWFFGKGCDQHPEEDGRPSRYTPRGGQRRYRRMDSATSRRCATHEPANC